MKTGTARRRTGFTLVELLVAMALIVLIMSILAQAFAEGLNVFREAKAVGDMQENLRAGVVRMRDDLLLRHFDGTQKLGVSFENYSRPTVGFFRVQQGSPAVPEGTDSDGLPSFRATDHILHLSVANIGVRRGDFWPGLAPNIYPPNQQEPSRHLWYSTAVPVDYRRFMPNLSAYASGGVYLSQWAEVMWFLRPMQDPDTGTALTAGASSTPLFSLYRRSRLLVDNGAATALNTLDRIPNQFYGRFAEIACRPDASGYLYFCTPADSEALSRRSMIDTTGNFSLPHPIGMPYLPGSPAFGNAAIEVENPAAVGEDRVISDVVSFEIKVLFPGSYLFMDIPGGVYDTRLWPVNDPANPGGGAGGLPPGGPGGGGSRVTIKAVQVILRVWDAKTEQTRQVTLIQDM